MITKAEEHFCPSTLGSETGSCNREQPLCIVGGSVTSPNGRKQHDNTSIMKRTPRTGSKSYVHPPCTQRTYVTALPEIGDKQNGIRGFSVFGKTRETHTGDSAHNEHGENDKMPRHAGRTKLESSRSVESIAIDGFPMDEFRQGGFSLMVRGANSSISFPSSRSVRSVCSSEDLIVTSIKLSLGEKENGSSKDRLRVSTKEESGTESDRSAALDVVSPGRFLINGKEVKMPEVPPPSMRSYYKPYNTTNNKFYPRSQLRRPQRMSPRPRTCIGNINDPPHFVPIQLKKSNKVAFENYLNNNAKPKSATLHRRPDSRRGKEAETDDKFEATPRVQFDVKSLVRKYSPAGQQTLAARIVDSNEEMEIQLQRLAAENLENSGERSSSVLDKLSLDSDEMSKTTLINQWLEDCVDLQKNKKTLVLSFPSIGEEAEDGDGQEGEEEEEEEEEE